ncbi:MAG: hypothetical protein AABY06_03930 [Nanoarchaeota archaeon]
MSNFLESTFFKWLKKASVYALFIVVLSLFLDFIKIINLDNVNIPLLNLHWILWIYLLINIGIATPLHYIKSNSSKLPNCPKCNKKLIINYEYECSKC